MIARKGRARTMEFGIVFNDKEQCIITVIRESCERNAISEHTIEYITDKKEYFTRKLIGK